MMYVEKKTLSPGTPHAAAYFVIHAAMPGPVCMIISGIHGNETASIRAAQRLADSFAAGRRLMRGRLVIVPLVNRAAYRKRTRGRPDLNRTFPYTGRSAVHPLSAAVFKLAGQHRPGWFLDLHEANGLSELNPRRVGQSLLISSGSRATGTAKRVIAGVNRSIGIRSRRFNLRRRVRKGTSRLAAESLLGARAITVETCWSLPFEDRIGYQTDIVLRVLGEAGML